jgi:serine/threonine protein kinase
MSPKQAGESGINVDPRTNVYALGVWHYELLTGHTPCGRARIRESDDHDISRIIREKESPRPNPLVDLVSTDAWPVIAKQCCFGQFRTSKETAFDAIAESKEPEAPCGFGRGNDGKSTSCSD